MNNIWKDYSKIFPRITEPKERLEKSYKIIKIIEEYNKNKNNEIKTVLDIGCSNGIITSELSNIYKKVCGTDIDDSALKTASENYGNKVFWFVSDTAKIPFKNNSLDLIVCNHIYQYLENPKNMLDEIYRVLKPDGICYYAVANKYALYFKNYPLTGYLWWFPECILKRLRKIIPSIFFKEKFLSKKNHLKLITKFEKNEYTIEVLKNPGKYFNNNIPAFYKIISKVPVWVMKIFIYFSFTYIWILKKEEGKDNI